MEQTLDEKIFLFEKKYNAFEWQDEQGTYIWDILRYRIYTHLLWDFTNRPETKEPETLLAKVRRRKWLLSNAIKFRLDTRRYHNLFYCFSRFRNNDKLLIDTLASDPLKLLEQETNLVLESNLLYPKSEYYRKDFYYGFPVILNRKKNRKKELFDFSNIVSLIEKEFGRCPFSKAQLNSFLSDFLCDQSYYKKLLKKHKIKRIFLVQNGLQKGLIAAAKELKIPVFEFQHGVVDPGHLAYSYPFPSDYPQVCFPDIVFTLSKWWFADFQMPKTKLANLGNSAFYNNITNTPKEKQNQFVMIISADVFGNELKTFLFEILKEPVSNDFEFFFKLHPNQYNEFKAYQDIFLAYPNVTVISDQMSIADLLKQCASVFTIQSTAVYEALQNGRKALIYKKSSYYRQQHIFRVPNVYVVDSVDAFFNALKQPPAESSSAIFFEDFNKKMFLNTINEVS
ncbi:MAG: hypothetical protein QM640_06590 [Niabella sp.]